MVELKTNAEIDAMVGASAAAPTVPAPGAADD
jgi:hypothetical protein